MATPTAVRKARAVAAKLTGAPDPAALYECLDSHLSVHGSFREGVTVYGTEADVAAHPRLWMKLPASEGELHRARVALRAGAIPPDAPFVPRSSDGAPLVLSHPPKDPAGFLVAVRPVPPTTAMGKGYSAMTAGTLVAKDSIVAKARPTYFRKATAADLPA